MSTDIQWCHKIFPTCVKLIYETNSWMLKHPSSFKLGTSIILHSDSSINLSWRGTWKLYWTFKNTLSQDTLLNLKYVSIVQTWNVKIGCRVLLHRASLTCFGIWKWTFRQTQSPQCNIPLLCVLIFTLNCILSELYDSSDVSLRGDTWQHTAEGDNRGQITLFCTAL